MLSKKDFDAHKLFTTTVVEKKNTYEGVLQPKVAKVLLRRNGSWMFCSYNHYALKINFPKALPIALTAVAHL